MNDPQPIFRNFNDAPSLAAVYEPVVILRPENARVADTARVDSFVKLECGDGLYIGEHVHIAAFCHILGGGRTIIEDGAACASGAKLVSGSNVPGPGHGCSAVAPDAVISKSFVHLKKNSIVFANAVVTPGCTLGEGSVLAAGAVLKPGTAVPDWEIWGGTPARFIRKNDREAAR